MQPHFIKVRALQLFMFHFKDRQVTLCKTSYIIAYAKKSSECVFFYSRSSGTSTTHMSQKSHLVILAQT